MGRLLGGCICRLVWLWCVPFCSYHPFYILKILAEALLVVQTAERRMAAFLRSA